MKKIFLSTSNGFYYLDLEQVLYFKTENPKTKVVLKNGQSAFLTKSLLKCIELVAPTPLPFFRISRFYLVNLNYLFEYTNRETKQLVLEDGTTLELSRNYKEAFLEFIKKMAKQ